MVIESHVCVGSSGGSAQIDGSSWMLDALTAWHIDCEFGSAVALGPRAVWGAALEETPSTFSWWEKIECNSGSHENVCHHHHHHISASYYGWSRLSLLSQCLLTLHWLAPTWHIENDSTASMSFSENEEDADSLDSDQPSPHTYNSAHPLAEKVAIGVRTYLGKGVIQQCVAERSDIPWRQEYGSKPTKTSLFDEWQIDPKPRCCLNCHTTRPLFPKPSTKIMFMMIGKFWL